MRTPPLLADFSHARACKPFCENSLTLPGANVLKYLFGGDFIAYNDKKQIITYEKYFHQTI